MNFNQAPSLEQTELTLADKKLENEMNYPVGTLGNIDYVNREYKEAVKSGDELRINNAREALRLLDKKYAIAEEELLKDKITVIPQMNYRTDPEAAHDNLVEFNELKRIIKKESAEASHLLEILGSLGIDVSDVKSSSLTPDFDGRVSPLFLLKQLKSDLGEKYKAFQKQGIESLMKDPEIITLRASLYDAQLLEYKTGVEPLHYVNNKNSFLKGFNFLTGRTARFDKEKDRYLDISKKAKEARSLLQKTLNQKISANSLDLVEFRGPSSWHNGDKDYLNELLGQKVFTYVMD